MGKKKKKNKNKKNIWNYNPQTGKTSPTTHTNNFIIHSSGARVFFDVMKHSMLEIPSFQEEKEEGFLCNVIAVGLDQSQLNPYVVIKEETGAKTYRIPREAKKWALDVIAFCHAFKTNIFPRTCEMYLLDEEFHCDYVEER